MAITGEALSEPAKAIAAHRSFALPKPGPANSGGRSSVRAGIGHRGSAGASPSQNPGQRTWEARLAWCKVGVDWVEKSTAKGAFLLRACGLLFPPPCEGGVRGGGPMTFECTREPCWARPIDEVDGACAASPAPKGLSFPHVVTGERRTHRRCGGSAAHPWRGGGCLAHPPCPHFARGGKEGRMCAKKRSFDGRLFNPANPNIAARQPCLPESP
jgi:hypothetical protein